MSELEKRAKPEKMSRPIYVYPIPKSLANGTTSIGLVELTASEELMATKRAGQDAFKLAYELAKQSLVEVNEQPVGLADGSVDKAFNEMGAKLRNLVLTAYAKLHAPNEEDSADFLRGGTVRVS